MIFSLQLVSCVQCNRIFLHHMICWTLWQLRTQSVLKAPRCKLHNCCRAHQNTVFSISDIAMQWQRFVIPISAQMASFLVLVIIVIKLFMYKIKAMELNEMGTLGCCVAFWQGSATKSWRFLLIMTYCSQYEGVWAVLIINTNVVFFCKFFKWSQWKSWES